MTGTNPEEAKNSAPMSREELERTRAEKEAKTNEAMKKQLLDEVPQFLDNNQ